MYKLFHSVIDQIISRLIMAHYISLYYSMYTKRKMLFPSPFTCVHPKVAQQSLSPILLSILSVSLLHSKWNHVPASLPEHQIQKTQTYTTFTNINNDLYKKTKTTKRNTILGCVYHRNVVCFVWSVEYTGRILCIRRQCPFKDWLLKYECRGMNARILCVPRQCP